MIIKRIFTHHTGGLGTNRLASTIHLTPEHINRVHAARWPLFRSELNGSWGGYTFAILPNAIVYQFRFIGETTAANKGYNNESVAGVVIGNYNKYPWGSPVDQMDLEIVEKMAEIQDALTNGDIAGLERLGLKTKPGTTFEVKIQNIAPHRSVARTECNGTSLQDSWGRDITIKLKRRKITLLQQLILLYVSILEFLQRNSSRIQGALIQVKKELPVSCLQEDVFG